MITADDFKGYNVEVTDEMVENFLSNIIDRVYSSPWFDSYPVRINSKELKSQFRDKLEDRGFIIEDFDDSNTFKLMF